MELYEQVKDSTSAQSDVFEFNDTAKIGITALQALESGLTSRGVVLADLSSSDSAAFKTAATQIAGILNSDVETTNQVEDLFGDELNITLVDDFNSIDGTALNGAAILDSDEIILDSALEGEELRETLIEEVAETAYQQAYGSTSAGDFGAEVLARIEGVQEDDLLAEYSTVEETDTVETAFGTAEAAGTTLDAIYLLSGVLGYDTVISSGDFIEEIFYLSESVFNERVDDTYEAAGITSDGFFDLRAPELLQNYFGQDLQDEASNADLSSYNITEGGTEYTFDFDGDGNPTTSIELYVDNYTDPSVQLIETGTTSLTPVDGLTVETYTGEGSSRFDYSVGSGESYTTASSWTVSGELTLGIGSAESGFGAFFDVGATYGQTQSNTITANESVDLAYTVYGSEYPEGTNVTSGLFGEVADATYTNSYDILIATSDSDGQEEGGYMRFEVADTQLIENHLIDIVLSESLTDDLIF